MYTSPMLKKILIMGLACLTVLPALAGEGLTTLDKSCRFYYITQKNTQGWYINVSPEMCKNGLVQGQGEVTIYNAFGKPTEQVYGFFNAGFWTGDKALNASILGQSMEPDGTQKVFFTVPNDTYAKAMFIGQMTATKQKDGSYTPFSFCAPFRVLVKTDDLTTFQKQEYTNNLVDGIVRQVRTLCPAEQTIMLYGASVEYPTPNDIFFYAIVNLQTAHIDVKKNAAFVVSQTPVISDFKPDALSGVPEVPVLPDDLSGLTGSPDGLSGEVSASEEDILPIPVPKTQGVEPLLPQEIPALLDKVPHLLLSSRVLQKPILGAAVMRIKSVQGTSGTADEPSQLTLMGDGLQPGWGVVLGTFTASKTLGIAGRVQVSSFVPCLQDRCQELEGTNE